jgi:hypothetical protein
MFRGSIYSNKNLKKVLPCGRNSYTKKSNQIIPSKMLERKYSKQLDTKQSTKTLNLKYKSV